MEVVRNLETSAQQSTRRLPADSPRGGLLGMSAIMAMGSNGEVSSPVERGAWVLRKLLHDPPPEGVTPTSFFLHSDGKANTRKGTGRLSRERPTKEQPADTFRADPANPVPACPVTATRPIKAAVWGPVDQTALEDRSDVLVYSTGPLAEPLTFAGNVEAKLHVSTDTPDADWAVKLVAVRPDGFAQNLAAGILRGRYRNSLLKPELMKPGQVYEITVDLGPCAATIAKGHQLRVDICGSLFPLHDRNPNTAEGIFSSKTAVATEQVHHRLDALSRLMLPISSSSKK